MKMIPSGVFDIIIFLGIGQGLILSGALFRIKNRNVTANNTLSLILLFACFMLLGRIIYVRYPSEWVYHWALLPDAVVFLFGPLSYIYLRRLLIKGEKQFILPIYHFIPFVLHIIIFIYLITAYTSQQYIQAAINGAFSQLFFGIGLTAILLNFFYCIKNFQLIKYFERKEKEEYSFTQNLVTYVKYFQLTILVCISLWGLSFITEHFLPTTLKFINYDSIWIAIPIFIYLNAYFSLVEPDIFKVLPKPKSQVKKNRLNSKQIDELKNSLEDTIRNKKVYRDAELSLSQLANMIDTTPNNLSWLLNEVYNTNFYDYINSHRIDEFIEKLNRGEHLNYTLLSMAYDVGFKSKSTFNKAFKHELKESPSSWVKKFKSEPKELG